VVGLGFAVAGSADGPALVVNVVGMPRNHAMKARGRVSKGVAYDGSHAVAAVVFGGLFVNEGGMMLSGGERDSRLSGGGRVVEW
jgi:hypothetical protein